MVFSLFSIVSVAARGKPNKPTVPCIIFYDTFKTTTSCFLCAIAFELNPPTIPHRSWRFKNCVRICCREQSTAGRDPSKQISLLCFYLSKTPAVHLLSEINLTLNSTPVGFFCFLELHAEAISNDPHSSMCVINLLKALTVTFVDPVLSSLGCTVQWFPNWEWVKTPEKIARWLKW